MGSLEIWSISVIAKLSRWGLGGLALLGAARRDAAVSAGNRTLTGVPAAPGFPEGPGSPGLPCSV